MDSLKIIFMGTAAIASPVLRALAQQPEVRLLAVVTQPDRPQGRALKIQPPPVKIEACRLSLPVLQPETARRPEFAQQLSALHPDMIVVAAYGQLLPQSVLSLPPFGCLNVHTSLLPKYRGAAPIQWAIINGETETGVTIMKMDAGLDTGEIISQQTTPIQAEDNALTLHDRLAGIGAELLVKTIPAYVSGQAQPRKQPAEGASYARKLTREDGLLDWEKSAIELWRRIRGLNPWPGAYTWLPKRITPAMLKIWNAFPEEGLRGIPGQIMPGTGKELLVACGTGGLRITTLQREGGRRLSAQEFLAGCPLHPGECLRSCLEESNCP
jgi:methionyl-tRNA formyltransferase